MRTGTRSSEEDADGGGDDPNEFLKGKTLSSKMKW
jgi:hypothetical protein